MKVLYVVGYPQRLNGAQKSLMFLIKAIRERGVEPLAAFTANGICAETYAAEAIPVQVMSLPTSASTYGKALLKGGTVRRALRALRVYPGIFLRAWRFVRSSGADVVHCNEPRALLVAGLPARLQGKRVVLHLRGSIDPYGRWLRKPIERIPHRIIAVGPSIASELSPAGRKRTRVVYNPIPIPAAAADGDRPPGDGERRVLVMASIVPHKGHHHIIEAAALIAASSAPYRVRFDILGQTIDEGYRAMLEARIASLGPIGVRLHGWRSDVDAFLREADVVVSASVDHEVLRIGDREIEVQNAEGTPRQLLEALAAGVPVVATRVPGVADVIEDQVTGLLVEPRDPRQLADAILAMLDDPEQARRMAATGRDVVAERHLPESSAAAVEAIYAELGAGRDRGDA
ncbi:MAG: glycosyltransferase family 4 protein [Actinobacteria bacterium]|nr:glycosyltransferase family 4 protein [Actinomycetota bacterium]